MSSHLLRHRVRPTLESLEDRCTPAGTVTGSLSGGVWRLTGDDNNNYLKVTSAGKPGAFTVTGLFGTAVTGIANPTGVQRIIFDLKDGSDSAQVESVKVPSMLFNGGNGDNLFNVSGLNLSQNLQVINGNGGDTTYLQKFTIGGNVTVNNGDGGSFTNLMNFSATPNFNSIAGNLTVTNGAGADYVMILDTDIGGNISNDNGSGTNSDAGGFRIFNSYQTKRRATVGGSINVRFNDGNISSNIIGDVVVGGEVLIHNGSGSATTIIDGQRINAPVVINGRFRVSGSGANVVSIGRQYKKTGLQVGQNFVIDVLNPTDLTLYAFNLFVQGQTKIV